MKPALKNLLFLLLFEIIILISGYLILSLIQINLQYKELAILSSLFTVIGLITFIIFFTGQQRKPENQTMFTLVAFTVKILIEFVLVLFWFHIAKKTGLASVLLFFVLYLAFTLFSIYIVLKALKYRFL